jgi:hypothetical protein
MVPPNAICVPFGHSKAPSPSNGHVSFICAWNKCRSFTRSPLYSKFPGVYAVRVYATGRVLRTATREMSSWGTGRLTAKGITVESRNVASVVSFMVLIWNMGLRS